MFNFESVAYPILRNSKYVEMTNHTPYKILSNKQFLLRYYKNGYFIKQCNNWFYILVPGGNDGPSGVLVSSENYLTYKNFGDQQDIRCPIPRRKVKLENV